MELLSKTETLSEKGNIAADSEDFQREADHLKNCLAIVRNNIDIYEQKERNYQNEVTQLFQSVRKGEGDAYGQLLAGQSILENTEKLAEKKSCGT